jgi:allantoinase
MGIVNNPSDAMVFAPHLPRTYDTVRPKWQAEKKLTVSLLLHAPFYLDTPEPGMYRPNLIPGGVGGAAPDSGAKPLHGQIVKLSQYDFGLANGIYRLMDIADTYGLDFAVALDELGARRVPFLARNLSARAAELCVRGQAVTSIISPEMTPDQELAYIVRSKMAVEEETGRTVSGWYSPERAGTVHTARLVKEAGFAWTADWNIDEVPVPLGGEAEGLTSLPFSLDTEDTHQLYTRGMRFSDYERLVHEAIDQLIADADAVGPRYLGLTWQGWVLGQACYADVAESVMRRLSEDPDIQVLLPSQLLSSVPA